jgi:hypothetical protein
MEKRKKSDIEVSDIFIERNISGGMNAILGFAKYMQKEKMCKFYISNGKNKKEAVNSLIDMLCEHLQKIKIK